MLREGFLWFARTEEILERTLDGDQYREYIPETTSIQLQIVFGRMGLGSLERLARGFLIVCLLVRVTALVGI